MKADESKALIERLGGVIAATVLVHHCDSDASCYDINRKRYGFNVKYYHSRKAYEVEFRTKKGKPKSWVEYGINEFKNSIVILSALDDALESLEQRPHPCATCPNHGHKACCHEVA